MLSLWQKGAGRVYRFNTNGGIVTGDGMGIALRHGVPLRDKEFGNITQLVYGLRYLMTEGCRGEGVFWSIKMVTVIYKIAA